MQVGSWMPTPAQIGREAITVVLGALVAALIVSQLPPLRDYIKRAWS